MHFEYEITVEQFVASQLLYHKLSGGRNHVERAVPWILSGIILVAIAWNEWSSLNWTPILLALIGAWKRVGRPLQFPLQCNEGDENEHLQLVENFGRGARI